MMLFDAAKLVVGTSAFGGLYESTSEETCFDAVARCLELGWRTFDTAPHYGLGLAEERLGRALARADESALVFTKVGRVIVKASAGDGREVDAGNLPERSIFKDAPRDRVAVLDLSAAGVAESLAASRARLGPRVEVAGVRVHDPELTPQLEAQAFPGAFAALRDSPEKVPEVSIGTNCVRAATRALGHVDAILLANRFNLLDQSGSALLRECQRRAIPVHVAGVYASGILAGGDTYGYEAAPAAVVAHARRWTDFLRAEYPDLTLRDVALAFAFLPLAVTRVVVGLRSKAEVDDAHAALQRLSSPDPRFWLELFQRARDVGGLVDPAALDLAIRPRFFSSDDDDADAEPSEGT